MNYAALTTAERPSSVPFAARCAIATMAIALALPALTGPGRTEELRLPVLAPITGFLSLEGTSQKNGAVLAIEHKPAGLNITAEVLDTAASPQTAVQAFERAMRGAPPIAISAPMLGTQMLALLPLAAERKIPLVTISGTAKITEMGSPWIFRFFPGDAVVKAAQARYAVEELGRRRVALIYQTTAYGQSGRKHLAENFARLGAEVVFEEALAPSVKDMLPALSKIHDTKANVIALQLHSGPTARLIKQARAAGIDLPIVAGSAMHQPSTAALLRPAELDGVCAETGASPISGGGASMESFTDAFRKVFDTEPDAFAVAQYDGITMVLKAIAKGVRTPEGIREALAGGTHKGLAMTYKSDGAGNMAHDALIVCYDGASRVPMIVKRYKNVDGVL